MPVHFERLQTGQSYNRQHLAELWGYRDWHAIGRGVFTPAHEQLIILFITGNKGESVKPYQDEFDGRVLRMEGEASHGSDLRLSQSYEKDQVHLFYRVEHRSPFVYCGQVFLMRHDLSMGESPSQFVFSVSKFDAIAEGSLVTERAAHGMFDPEFSPDTEGSQHINQHVMYERSRRNRARALELHGTTCAVCGFDFDHFYGPDLARSYIEIHHKRSLSVQAGPVNPDTELVPLCSNCHSMAHRNPNEMTSIEELKTRVRDHRDPISN
jgi:5-methylcytosine-specific restriction enzyme A